MKSNPTNVEFTGITTADKRHWLESMIAYTDSLTDVSPDDLKGGFFVGWPNPPSLDTRYRILINSAAIVLARLEDGTVVGFITAISDGISCAYIPHLEVLPAYQERGIGSELVRRMLEKLKHLYMGATSYRRAV